MSSNGLESLGDIGPGMINWQTLNKSAPTQTPILISLSPLLFLSSSADLSSAQCIPAPLATPIPVSDDPATPVVTPCTDLSESPSSQALPPMPYSVPVSEHMEECSSSVIKDELDSLLDCIPKKVSEVSEGQMSEKDNHHCGARIGFILKFISAYRYTTYGHRCVLSKGGDFNW